ncbi:unnamed protein product, partial [Staurois parvus]
WGPQEIGDHGAPVSLPKLKKAYEKGTRGISWGPLLTLGPWAVTEFPNGQSAPAYKTSEYIKPKDMSISVISERQDRTMLTSLPVLALGQSCVTSSSVVRHFRLPLNQS